MWTRDTCPFTARWLNDSSISAPKTFSAPIHSGFSLLSLSTFVVVVVVDDVVCLSLARKNVFYYLFHNNNTRRRVTRVHRFRHLEEILTWMTLMVALHSSCNACLAQIEHTHIYIFVWIYISNGPRVTQISHTIGKRAPWRSRTRESLAWFFFWPIIKATTVTSIWIGIDNDM